MPAVRGDGRGMAAVPRERDRHSRGRRRIGRRCGCLPGAWGETGHAALPGPGPNRGCNPLPHEPKHRENPLPRPGASTTRPPWPVDPEPAPPAGSHTAAPIRAEGAVPPRAEGAGALATPHLAFEFVPRKSRDDGAAVRAMSGEVDMVERGQ